MLLLIVLLLLTNPAMLISLSMLQQGSNLRKVANSSKQQQQQQQQQQEKVEGQTSRGQLLDALLPAEQLSQPLVVTPRRPTLLGNLPGSSAAERSRSSSSRPKPKVGSEEQLRHKRQHAFELGLEKMLFEVEKGWEADLKKDGKKKRVDKPPGWQKIWYKRLG